MLLKDRIKNLRKELSLTQKELANAINKSIDRVKNIENGRVQKLHPQEITLISKKYNINPDWLLTGEGEMYRTPSVQNAIIAQGNNHKIIGNVVGSNPNNELKEICEAIQKLPEKKRKYFYHLIMAEMYKEEE